MGYAQGHRSRELTVKARVTVVLLALVVMSGVVAARVTFTPRTARMQTAGRSAPVLRRQHRRYLGMVTTNLAASDKAAGLRANLTVRYLAWGSPLGTELLAGNALLGAETLIELLPRTKSGRVVSVQSIAAGRQDGYLRTVARDIQLSGDDVMISFAPEANGGWYPWGIARRRWLAKAYRAAWRRVYDVITAGVPGRVSWLWQVAVSYHGSAPLPLLWPGSRYVNITGVDGYYEVPDSTFGSVFGSSLKAVSFTKKPVLLSETAVGPATQRQAADITDLFAALAFHRLLGLVWFDISQHAGVHHQDWRFQDSGPALAAFRLAARKWLDG